MFGEGPARARLVMVGEQPGHDGDLAGHPFVGPAARILDRALAAARIMRDDVYVTNVVKHFKWEPRGTRRIHAKPNQMEIAACLPRLEAELDLVRPVVRCIPACWRRSIPRSSARPKTTRGAGNSTPWSRI